MLFLIVWINCKFMEVAKLPPDFTNFWGALLDSPNIFHIFSQARDGSTKEGRQNGLHEGFPLFSSSRTTKLIETLGELGDLGGSGHVSSSLWSNVSKVTSLKGGSLMSKSKSTLSDSVSQWVTRSPIKLFWTAKNELVLWRSFDIWFYGIVKTPRIFFIFSQDILPLKLCVWSLNLILALKLHEGHCDGFVAI